MQAVVNRRSENIMKKKLSYLLLLFVCSFIMGQVYAANIAGCDSFLGKNLEIDEKKLDDALANHLDVDEKIANTVHIVILVIQIVVPIVLVVFGMIDLVKAVIAGKEDEIKKNQMTFVKRLIAAAIVFFVFVIVKLLVSFVADDSKNMMNCVNCFINGTGKSCATRAN